MWEKTERQVESYKIWAMAVLFTGSCISLFYFHVILGIDTIVTHIFYVPIVLAAFWWKRKGLVVALFSSGLLIISHVFLRPDMASHNDYFRAFMFMVTAFLVAELSRRIAKEQEALQTANQQLKAGEQQLKASNQQLSADEQQLKASNQQLSANEQQLVSEITERKKTEKMLRAANQQLMASEQQLKASNQQLMASEQQLKASNQQLMASEQEARILAKFPSENPNPVLRISKDNAVLYSNQAGNTILDAWGCEENRCLCLPDRESKLMKKALSSGKPIAFDFDYRGRTFSITLAPVPESEYFNMYALDITDRKQAEDQMQQERDKAQKYLDVAEVMLIVIDAKQKVSLINQKGCKILGYDEKDIIDKNWLDNFLPKRMRKDVKGVFEKLLGGEMEPFEYFENPVLTKDGDERILAWHNTLLRNEQGCIIGVLSSGEDITERKKAEEKLLDYQEKLKSLASQLLVIEERERHRLATLLHDQIGQSLVFSKLKLDELRVSGFSGESTDVLGEVCDCLGDVIRDTRTLTFDLSSPILYELGFETAVSEWLDEQIREKHGIQTEFRDDGQPKPLDDDISALLFRNVRELLINIVKHAKARKVKVSVSKVDEQICVIVEDDGVGFKTAELASNTGFGIFSIRERLEQLDGHLEIESEPGRGSRFTMTAPLKVEKSTEGAEV